MTVRKPRVVAPLPWEGTAGGRTTPAPAGCREGTGGKRSARAARSGSGNSLARRTLAMLAITPHDGLFSAATENLLNALFSFTAWEQHTAATSFAFEADIRTETHHAPVRAPAWMRLAQAHAVV